MATREDYIAKFKTTSEAIRFEDRVLDGGVSCLPECAKPVMLGHEPTPEYWDFLIRQLSEMSDAQMFLIEE
jgi:hypothetical protein